MRHTHTHTHRIDTDVGRNAYIHKYLWTGWQSVPILGGFIVSDTDTAAAHSSETRAVILKALANA
jgi:hypothetical protein